MYFALLQIITYMILILILIFDIEDIDAYNMIVFTMLIPCYLSTHISRMQDPSVRIYIIATYAVHARPLLCEVAHL